MPSPLVAAYYWLTPLFWAADVFLGANLRTSALEGNTVAKTLYYLFCIACGAAIWFRPALTSLIGLIEASLQILLLVLGVLVPYFRVIDQLAAGEAPVTAFSFGLESALGFLLAGTIWALSFRMHSIRLFRR